MTRTAIFLSGNSGVTDNYCMIGNHAIPVLVDAVLKKIPGIDAERVTKR